MGEVRVVRVRTSVLQIVVGRVAIHAQGACRHSWLLPKCNVLESFGIALANRTASNSFCDCRKCHDCAARRDVWLKRGFRLSIDFLKICGLLEFKFDRKPAVRIPYFAHAGIIWNRVEANDGVQNGNVGCNAVLLGRQSPIEVTGSK
jgi:hypothetical protein